MRLGLMVGMLAGLLLAHRLILAQMMLAASIKERTVRQRYAGLARERRKEAA